MSDLSGRLPNVGQRPCRGEHCGAEVAWCWGSRGGLTPVDPDPHPDGNLRAFRTARGVEVVVSPPDLLGGDRYMPHFATCPDAESFRDRGGPDPT